MVETSVTDENSALPAEGFAKKGHRKAAPTSLAALITSFYLDKGRPRALKSRDLECIAKDIAIPDGLMSELQPVLASVRGLDAARGLMYLAARMRDRPALRAVLYKFVEAALCQHPSFAASEKALACIRNLPDAPPARIVFEQVLTPARSDATGTKQAKGKRGKEARSAAATTLAVWLHVSREYPLENMIRDLHLSLWDGTADRLRDQVTRVQALIEKPTAEGYGLIGAVFRDEARRYEAVAIEARRAEAHVRSELQRLQTSVDSLQAQLEDRNARIAALEVELAAERSRHEVATTHATDDYAQLRARFTRLVREQRVLLEEGLHALRRVPPKVDVMDDHAERVLQALERARREIEGGN